MTTNGTHQLVARYIALWTEPDERARRRAIEDLWVAGGVEHTGANRYHGHDAIARRVTAAHQQFFDGGQSRLRLADTPVVVDDAVSFTIEILPVDGGEPTWTGRIFLLADGGERIHADYQFTIPP